MTEADDDALDRASAPPPIDLSALGISVDIADAPADAFGTPNHRATDQPRAGRGSRLLPGGGRGTKKDGEPRTARKTAPRARKTPTPTYRREMFVEPLTNAYAGLGMMLMPFDPTCAMAVVNAAESCARSLDKLAETNPAVRRMLWNFTNTSAVGLVIAAHAPILLAIAMHHIPAVQNLAGSLGLAQFTSQYDEHVPPPAPSGDAAPPPPVVFPVDYAAPANGAAAE